MKANFVFAEQHRGVYFYRSEAYWTSYKVKVGPADASAVLKAGIVVCVSSSGRLDAAARAVQPAACYYATIVQVMNRLSYDNDWC